MRSFYFGDDVKRIVFALSAFLLAPTAMSAEPVEPEKPAAMPPLIVAEELRDAILRLHNARRLDEKLPPLVWDDSLAKAADIWAQDLNQRNAFEHAPSAQGPAAQGENLWMGTRDAYSIDEMVGMWLDEGDFVRPGIFPDISKTGDWRDVGHFTQMLWPSTQSIGCALIKGAADEILVCRYFPAGNRIGQPFGSTRGK